MATYSPPTGSEVGHKKPLTVSLVSKLMLNPIAITEGAAGAPRILGQAIARAGNGLPVLSVSASDAYDLSEGLSPTVGALTHSSTVPLLAYAYTVLSFTGSVRMRASYQAGGGTSTFFLQKNFVNIYSLSTTSTTPQLVSFDVAVAPGDDLRWLHSTTNVSFTTTMSGLAVRASNAYIAQPAWRPAV